MHVALHAPGDLGIVLAGRIGGVRVSEDDPYDLPPDCFGLGWKVLASRGEFSAGDGLRRRQHVLGELHARARGGRSPASFDRQIHRIGRLKPNLDSSIKTMRK